MPAHLTKSLTAAVIVLASAGAGTAHASDLLGLAEKTLDDAIHSPIKASTSLGLGSYANVGVTVGGKLLADSDLTPEMRDANAAFTAAGKGTPIWIRQEFQGGPTISWAASTPINPTGSLSLDYGFSLGATVDYLCEDQLAQPQGVTDATGIWNIFKNMPERVVDLPLTADEGLAQVEGTHRVLQGTGSLAIDGGVTAGLRLYQLGIFGATSGIDFGASVAVTWSISDNLRCEITREAGQQIRVHWSNTAATSFGPSASAVIGLTVDPSLIDKAAGVAGGGLAKTAGNAIVTALVNQGAQYTRISFGWSKTWSTSDVLDVNLLFDLSNPASHALYEAAVRGNISAAQKLGVAGPSQGVLQCAVTSSLTDADNTGTSASVFNLLTYSDSSSSSQVQIDVKQENGSDTISRIWNYSDSTKYMFVDGTDSLSAAATDVVVTAPGIQAQHGTRVDMHQTHVLEKTQGSDITSYLNLARTLFGDAANADVARLSPENDWDDDGHVQLDMNVSLGPLAQEKVLSIDQSTFLRTYSWTFVDKSYDWTPARVSRMDNPTIDDIQGWVGDPDAKDLWTAEAQGLAEARSIYALVEAAAAGSDDAKLKVFADIAKENGYNRRAMTALALLAHGLDVELELKLTGAKATMDHASGSVTALPSAP